MRLVLCTIVATLAASAAERFPVDWKAQQPEILDQYLSLLRIDTSNPPGNETKAVEFL